MKTREEIKQDLIDLQFNVNSRGIEYWITAIELYQNEIHKYSFSMIDMYKVIAKKYDTTYSRVERAMRHAREDAEETIHLVYNYYNKLDTRTVIRLIGGI